MAILRDFATRYRRLHLQTRHALSEDLEHQVASGEIDAAVVLASIRELPLDHRHLQDVQLSVWVHPANELAGRAALTLAELEAKTIALVHEKDELPSGFNRALRALFAAAEVDVDFQQTLELVPRGRSARPRSSPSARTSGIPQTSRASRWCRA